MKSLIWPPYIIKLKMSVVLVLVCQWYQIVPQSKSSPKGQVV